MASSPPEHKNPKESLVEEGTRVDLGDDLLAVSVEGAPSRLIPASARAPASARDDLDSARILMDEGLLEDARRALFRVLRNEPGNRLALGLLEQIRTTEIRSILKPDSRAQAAHARAHADQAAPHRDPEQIIAQLELDWHLELGPSESERLVARQWISQGLGPESSLQERMDWAVALVQLGLPDLGVEVLEACGQLHASPSATALHARASLESGRPEAARALAEQALRDPDFPKDLRDEMGYLRAMSFLRLGQRSEAAAIFRTLGNYRESRAWVARLTSQAPDPRKKR